MYRSIILLHFRDKSKIVKENVSVKLLRIKHSPSNILENIPSCTNAQCIQNIPTSTFEYDCTVNIHILYEEIAIETIEETIFHQNDFLMFTFTYCQTNKHAYNS